MEHQIPQNENLKNLFDSDPTEEVVNLSLLTSFPSTTIPITQSGQQVIKYIISEGLGDIIAPTSRIKLKLVPRDEEGKIIKGPGGQANQLKKYKLNGRVDLIPSIYTPLLTMKPQEIAFLKIPSQSSDKESENEEIQFRYFRVELVSEEKINVQGANGTGQRDYKKDIEICKKKKEEGNAFFIAKNFKKAQKSYRSGAGMLLSFPKKAIESFTQEELIEFETLRGALMSNLAKSFYQAGNFKDGLNHLEKSVPLMQENEKFMGAYLELMLNVHKEEQVLEEIDRITDTILKEKFDEKEEIDSEQDQESKIKAFQALKKLFIKKIKEKRRKEDDVQRKVFQEAIKRKKELEIQQKIWERMAAEKKQNSS